VLNEKLLQAATLSLAKEESDHREHAGKILSESASG
jgi:hypothetical protein